MNRIDVMDVLFDNAFGDDIGVVCNGIVMDTGEVLDMLDNNIEIHSIDLL